MNQGLDPLRTPPNTTCRGVTDTRMGLDRTLSCVAERRMKCHLLHSISPTSSASPLSRPARSEPGRSSWPPISKWRRLIASGCGRPTSSHSSSVAFLSALVACADSNYFQVAPSHCVSAMSSHVMSILLELSSAIWPRLLPGRAVALRLGAVIPGHDIPPCPAEARGHDVRGLVILPLAASPRSSEPPSRFSRSPGRRRNDCHSRPLRR